MFVRWHLTDPATSEDYEFEINPNEGGSPQRKRLVDSTPTVAPDGIPIIYEGRESPIELSWSGILRTEEQFNAIRKWYNKRHQILLTDDLGRTMWIYIIGFSPNRVRAQQAPWKHEYSIEARVLDWPL